MPTEKTLKKIEKLGPLMREYERVSVSGDMPDEAKECFLEFLRLCMGLPLISWREGDIGWVWEDLSKEKIETKPSSVIILSTEAISYKSSAYMKVIYQDKVGYYPLLAIFPTFDDVKEFGSYLSFTEESIYRRSLDAEKNLKDILSKLNNVTKCT